MSRSVLLLLALLVAASFALCVWYAGHGLHGGRFWDERFTVENVRGGLASGWIRPINGYYQTLSYLPQALFLEAAESLHRWAGVEAAAALVAALAPAPFLFAYREVVPTTEEVARRFLATRFRGAGQAEVRVVLSDHRAVPGGGGLRPQSPPPGLVPGGRAGGPDPAAGDAPAVKILRWEPPPADRRPRLP